MMAFAALVAAMSGPRAIASIAEVQDRGVEACLTSDDAGRTRIDGDSAVVSRMIAGADAPDDSSEPPTEPDVDGPLASSVVAWTDHALRLDDHRADPHRRSERFGGAHPVRGPPRRA